MAVSRVKTSSVLQGFPKSRSLLAGNAAFQPTSFESIASATGTGSSGSITFSSIPSTYTSLQIRGLYGAASGSGYGLYIRLNGDSSSNYAYHAFYGDGSTASAFGAATQDKMYATFGTVSSTVNGVTIIDLQDYASTTRNKTVRFFSGEDANGSGTVDFMSGLRINTAAITSVTLVLEGGLFSTSSQFALYGIKGA
jgi:hypothetical protein